MAQASCTQAQKKTGIGRCPVLTAGENKQASVADGIKPRRKADPACAGDKNSLHHFTCFVLFKCECVLLLEPTINPTAK
ncbi:hypothetical protein [Pseudomonas sp. Marseille-Q5117]|uniref:hypothetical protein n=1 Tax=Pseudomonas sp. Marseille-Q5117 TaxID=2972777 RepID=UPI0021C9E2C9|nr:hypothetical protein [Pseudomonas sp. Marseille-Q5117]